MFRWDCLRGIAKLTKLYFEKILEEGIGVLTDGCAVDVCQE